MVCYLKRPSHYIKNADLCGIHPSVPQLLFCVTSLKIMLKNHCDILGDQWVQPVQPILGYVADCISRKLIMTISNIKILCPTSIYLCKRVINAPGVETGISRRNSSIPWLLMPGLLVPPGHQQLWRRLSKTNALRYEMHSSLQFWQSMGARVRVLGLNSSLIGTRWKSNSWDKDIYTYMI